jgi:hypothetical protein
MQDEVIATPTPQKRVPWNKGRPDRSQAAAATETCLGDPDEVDDALAIAEQVDG